MVAEPANDFVRDFIGAERIERQRAFGEKKLKEFLLHFDAEWSGDAQKIASSASIEEAASQLEGSPHSRLAITEGDRVVAYASERDLLKAALQKDRGTLN